MGVQGAWPPAGARGVPALSLFPKRLADDALGWGRVVLSSQLFG